MPRQKKRIIIPKHGYYDSLSLSLQSIVRIRFLCLRVSSLLLHLRRFWFLANKNLSRIHQPIISLIYMALLYPVLFSLSTKGLCIFHKKPLRQSLCFDVIFTIFKSKISPAPLRISISAAIFMKILDFVDILTKFKKTLDFWKSFAIIIFVR